MHSMNKGVHQKAECTLSVLRFLMNAFFSLFKRETFFSSKEKLFSLQKRKNEKKALIFFRPVWGEKKALPYKSGKNIRRENSGSDNRKE